MSYFSVTGRIKNYDRKGGYGEKHVQATWRWEIWETAVEFPNPPSEREDLGVRASNSPGNSFLGETIKKLEIRGSPGWAAHPFQRVEFLGLAYLWYRGRLSTRDAYVSSPLIFPILRGMYRHSNKKNYGINNYMLQLSTSAQQIDDES